MCDPFRVVMWFVGGGRFPGALPPARLPVPFQGASRSTSRTSQGRYSIYYAPGTGAVQQIRAPERPCQGPEIKLPRQVNHSPRGGP
jgi:hypothetical protein